MSYKEAIATVVLGAALVAPASAVTVDISQSVNFAGTAFNLLEQSVVLPTGFSNALINIHTVYANDAAVLQVNGVNIVGWGIFGPGDGSFAFDSAGPFVSFQYALGHQFAPLAVNQSYTAPFVAGNNTIKLFHNDNGNGIAGGQFHLNSGSVQFSADITYTAAVPEPETYAMLLAGLGLVGATARRRRAQRASGTHGIRA